MKAIVLLIPFVELWVMWISRWYQQNPEYFVVSQDNEKKKLLWGNELDMNLQDRNVFFLFSIIWIYCWRYRRYLFSFKHEIRIIDMF